MSPEPLPTGAFTCDLVVRPVRAPAYQREERDGATYLVARDYEMAYETTLRFEDGRTLAVRARLHGEVNQGVIVRGPDGRPRRLRGWVQGRLELCDGDGRLLFRGRYHDAGLVQPLAGDDALTPTGVRVVDHWENAFGEGRYAGHAFALGVQLTRTVDEPLHGPGRGLID